MFGGSNKAKAAGPICAVPGDYATIQAAVNDAGCATINVAPGLYNENVNVNRSVTLNGAQAGIDARGRVAAESTVSGANPINGNAVFTINAAGVTVDGFTLKNSLTTGAAYGISVNSTGSNAVITNNIFDGINTTDGSGNGTAQAIYLQGGPDGVNISKNEMKNIQSPRSAKGVLVGDNGGTNPSSNTVIKANSISFVTSLARGAYGVSVASVTPGTNGLQVSDNTIDNLNGVWAHAIGLEGDTPGAIVNGNDISNMTSSNPDNIAVWFEGNPSFATVQVHSNNFNLTTASFGIAVQPTLPAGSVDGSCNWWNSPTGPTAASNPGGTGAMVSPKVIYAPWLIAPDGSCIGGNVATTANQCKNGGWATRVRADGSTFKNQGDCIQYVNTGK